MSANTTVHTLQKLTELLGIYLFASNKLSNLFQKENSSSFLLLFLKPNLKNITKIQLSCTQNASPINSLLRLYAQLLLSEQQHDNPKECSKKLDR